MGICNSCNALLSKIVIKQKVDFQQKLWYNIITKGWERKEILFLSSFCFLPCGDEAYNLHVVSLETRNSYWYRACGLATTVINKLHWLHVRESNECNALTYRKGFLISVKNLWKVLIITNKNWLGSDTVQLNVVSSYSLPKTASFVPR